MKTARGAALLWVLWLLALGTAVLVIGLRYSSHNYAVSGLLRQQSQLQAHADAGLEKTLWHLDPRSGASERWRAGQVHQFAFEGSQLTIQIRDEAALIDVNQASPALLKAYFEVCGVPAPQAARFTEAIIQYRRRETGVGAIQSVAELQQVPEFPGAAMANCWQALSVHAELPIPYPLNSSPEVLEAIQLAGLTPATSAMAGLSGRYRITVQVQSPQGQQSHLQAVVQIISFDPTGRSYRMLWWQRGLMDSE